MEPCRELRDLMLGLYHDWSAGNDAWVEMLSPRDDVVGIGTDPAEWWVGGERLKALQRVQVREIGPITFVAGDLVTFSEGSVGWVADNPIATLADGTVLKFRVSLVFHREGVEWKAVHLHASFGAETTEILGFEVTTSIDAVAEAVDAQRPDLAPVASPEGTLTIMFTDLEASTATNEAMGDDTFLPLLLRHHAIVEDHTRSAGGTVVKSQGDGFMLAFPSARRGVDCAIAVQRDVTALDERLKVRMGLHTGEPVRHSDDFFGRDVAYAARVGSAANGREILVSSLVKSLVEPAGSYEFDGPRELELKGFDGLQPIYAVRWR